MGQVTLSGTPPIEISLRRSNRARRISLRVSGVDGKVTLTLPNGVPEREGLAFAKSRRGWISDALDRRPDNVRVDIGTEVPVEGRLLPVEVAHGRGTRLEAERIAVPPGRPAGLRCRRH